MNDSDDLWFSELVRPEIDRLYRLAYRLTLQRADAEDLVQDVLIKAYDRRRELSSIPVLSSWLARVLYNHFIDGRRRYARRRLHAVPVAVESAADSGPEPAESAERGDDIRRLQKALAELSLDHRSVLLMHDGEGYKLEEIQIITGVPVGTLKSRLHRARARLRALVTVDGTV
jgi:RNA polymerase sigma-70 factor (ECF subfamily)